MTALRHKNEPARLPVRKSQWLATLERELRSRVGWVDEAVSPFAGRKCTEPAPAKIRPQLLRGNERSVFPRRAITL